MSLRDTETCKENARIAIALPGLLPFGGAERVWVTLAEEFMELGYSIDVVLANDESTHQELMAVVPKTSRIYNFGSIRLRNFVVPFAHYLRTEKPDVVLTAMWPFTLLCVLGNIVAGSPSRIIVSEHSLLSLQYAKRGFFREAFMRYSLIGYRLADACIAVSTGVAKDVSTLSGIARTHFHVIHNPLPSMYSMHTMHNDTTDRRAAEAVWNGWKGSRIITVGQLKTVKNHTMLLKAFRRLLAWRDARLMILGAGEEESETRMVIEQEGLSGKVLMPGHTLDPIPFYQSATLFVLSSNHEGFGNVIIEAMACGLPVVSTNCPSGPAEILENGRFGCLTPVGDAHAFAKAMLKQLTTDHDSEILKRRSQDFSPDIIAQKYLNVLFPNRSASSA